MIRTVLCLRCYNDTKCTVSSLLQWFELYSVFVVTMIWTVQCLRCHNDLNCTVPPLLQWFELVVSPLLQWFELIVSASLFQLFELYSTAVPCLLNCFSELYSIYFIVLRTGRECRAVLVWQINIFKTRVQCCFTSTETLRTIRDGEPRTATSTFTQLLSSFFWCWFKSKETIRTIRDGEPRTATSSFTLFLSSFL